MIIPSSHPDPSSSSHTTSYRIKRGSKLVDLPSYQHLPSLSELDGPFQLSEYLAFKVRSDPHNVRSLVEVPRGDDQSGGKGPEKNVWIYEHLRRLPIDLTPLITSLLPICSKVSCPEMKAEQWLYFCSAHPETADCCAIDYILHTIDSTTALLNSSQQFPSRMTIPPSSLSHFPSLFRRLSRIFSHAYFHHREAFSLSEAETSLYARFVALCERYDLVGANLLAIPRDVLASLSQPVDDSDEDEEEEEDEEDEDEEEEEESDDDAEHSGTHRGRGGKGDNREKRTRSLDRHGSLNSADVSVGPSPARLISRDTLTASDFAKPASPASAKSSTTTAITTDISPGKEDPFRSSPRAMGSGRGTLGRGKQSRGTMLWNSDMPAVPDVPVGPELSRTESNQTAVLIEESSEEIALDAGPAESVGEVAGSSEPSTAAGADSADDAGEATVPKDEIELLEEEGVIPPATTVFPLIPPAAGEVSPAAEKAESEESQSLKPGERGGEDAKGPERAELKRESNEVSKDDTEAIKASEGEDAESGDVEKDLDG